MLTNVQHLALKKQLTKSIQYLPKLFVNNYLVPRIEIGKSFRYLGRYLDYNMSDEKHKSELIKVFNDIMNKIDELPLHPEKQNSFMQSLFAVKNILLFPIYLRHGSAKRQTVLRPNISENG